MQLLAVIFVCRRSNARASGFWVSTGTSNTYTLSAADRAIFNHLQS
jgi:hypothetical protein